MAERPIIFSTEMVKAILEGRKTQTRRVIKTFRYEYPSGIADSLLDIDGSPCFVAKGNIEHLCSYGQVGDRLWVRESWATEKWLDHLSPSELGNAADVPLWYSDQRSLLERGKESGIAEESLHCTISI